jgi:putative glutamine amidotransferase
MNLPLIGLTATRLTGRSGQPMHAVPEAYVRALSEAGALPVLIPLGLPESALGALLERLDGVLFTGGGDIVPERYHGTSIEQVNGVDPDRDRVELCLVQDVLKSQTPFFGICRGFQVVNVAMGGTLYEDIGSQLEGALKHDYYPDWARDHLAHEVRLESGSRLAGILEGGRFRVNSLHHQGVRDLAPGLSAVAHSPDGLVEAVEIPGHPFGLSVQWHPECLPDRPEMRRLFRAFVEAAARHRA